MGQSRDHVRWSKRLSYVLRHAPSSVGVELDLAGWTEVDALVSALGISRALLDEIVETSDKQRFAFSGDGRRIRASQGHSVPVDLGYEPSEPPEVLFHGTHPDAVEGIRTHGIQKMSRHQVHLSPDVVTAEQVGGRRGTPVVLTVRAGRMFADGYVFYVSANGVWLTEVVPPDYVDVPAS